MNSHDWWLHKSREKEICVKCGATCDLSVGAYDAAPPCPIASVTDGPRAADQVIEQPFWKETNQYVKETGG